MWWGRVWGDPPAYASAFGRPKTTGSLARRRSIDQQGSDELRSDRSKKPLHNAIRGLISKQGCELCAAFGSLLAYSSRPWWCQPETITRCHGEPSVSGHSLQPAVAQPDRTSSSHRQSTRPIDSRGRINGFTTRVSTQSGDPVGLKVSTRDHRFRVVALRWGWYRGRPLHRVWSSSWRRQGLQPAPVFRPFSTRTVVAPWRVSMLVHTKGWRPGLYVLKLISGRGAISNVPLVVRSRSARGRVALVAPVTTWQSYNDWGGYSLYHGPPGARRSWAVSYDRPYQSTAKARQLFGASQIAVRAERLGIDLAYLTNVDLEANPRSLSGARAYVSLGHDEYWSRSMRRRVAEARARGTNLAFFGANTEYWRIRLQDKATGRNRLQVGYRSDAALDPVARRHPRLTTARWRDRPVPAAGEHADRDAVRVLPRRHRVPGGLRLLVGIPSHRRPQRNCVSSPRRCGGSGPRVPDPVDAASAADRRAQSLLVPRCRHVQPSRLRDRSLRSGDLQRRAPCGGRARCRAGATPLCHAGPRTRHFVKTVTDNVIRRFAHPRVGGTLPARDNVRRFHLPRHNQVSASKQPEALP